MARTKRQRVSKFSEADQKVVSQLLAALAQQVQFGDEAAFYKEYYVPFLTAARPLIATLTGCAPQSTPVSSLPYTFTTDAQKVQWHAVPKDMPAGRPKKTPIRAISVGSGRPESRNPFTEEESKKIIEAREIVGGNRWLEIATFLPHRNPQAIKKHWHANLKAKLERELKAFNEGLPRGPFLTVVASAAPLASKSATPKLRQSSKRARRVLDDEEELRSGDISRIRAVYHRHYLRQLPEYRKRAAEMSDWEDVCLLCKDGGEVVMCDYAHRQDHGTSAAPPGSQRSPCWKSYHLSCLGVDKEPPESEPWLCPRHKCCYTDCISNDGDGASRLYMCETCPSSYCELHVPAAVRPLVVEFDARDVEIKCVACQALDPPKSSAALLSQDDSEADDDEDASDEDDDTDRTVEEAAERLREERRERDREDRERRERERAELPEPTTWQGMIETIRSMATNSGGRIRATILKAIDLAKSAGRMDIVSHLEAAISPGIYKNNSAGQTKHMALRCLTMT
eukprot:jgi/Chlat1/9039/Chrsp94S08307